MLRQAAVPADVDAFAWKVLDEVSRVGVGSRVCGSSPADDLTIAEYRPRLHVAGLDDIRRGRREGAAKSCGWRYLVLREGEIVEVIDIGMSDGPRSVPEWRGSGRGRLDPMAASINAACESVPLKEAEYELRLLQVPALNVEAVWLASADRADLFVPISGSAGLEAGRPVSPEVFWRALEKVSRESRSEGAGLRPDRGAVAVVP